MSSNILNLIGLLNAFNVNILTNNESVLILLTSALLLIMWIIKKI